MTSPADSAQERERTHGRVMMYVFWSSPFFAAISLIGAGLLRYFSAWCYSDPAAKILVGLWVAIPPLWFLYEYVHFPPPAGIKDERMRHLHDLCRNLWLALVAILTGITGIHPFGA